MIGWLTAMVDFALSDEQKMMRDMARDFARTEIRPLADIHYRRGEKIPAEALDDVLKKANALRFIDYNLPEMGGERPIPRSVQGDFP